MFHFIIEGNWLKATLVLAQSSYLWITFCLLSFTSHLVEEYTWSTNKAYIFLVKQVDLTLNAMCSKKWAVPLFLAFSYLLPASIHSPTWWEKGETQSYFLITHRSNYSEDLLTTTHKDQQEAGGEMVEDLSCSRAEMWCNQKQCRSKSKCHTPLLQ